MEVTVGSFVYEEVKNSEGSGCLGCTAYDNNDLCTTLKYSSNADCHVSVRDWKVWKIKEVKEPIKPKEKEFVMEVEVNGIVYESHQELVHDSCDGCAAQGNYYMCSAILSKEECCPEDGKGVIWLKKEIKQPTSDLNQNPSPSTKEEKETLVEPSKGVKNDSGKIEWSYLPIEPMNEVLKVLMLGDKKYPSPDGCNWKVVPNAKKRYYNAALRHLTSWYNGEKTDQETGYNHLAHAVTNCLFLLWFEIKGYPKD